MISFFINRVLLDGEIGAAMTAQNRRHAVERAVAILRAGEAAAISVGLDLDQAAVLVFARAEGRVSRSDVRQMLGCSQPRFSRLLNKMEAAGLIRRVVPKDNHRVVSVQIDDAGWAAIEGLGTGGACSVTKAAELQSKLRDAVGCEGVTDLQARVLLSLEDKEATTSQIAARMRLGRTSVDMCLKSLSLQGLARRREQDGFPAMYRETEKGRRYLEPFLSSVSSG